jgi:hypothetical protein
MVVKRADNGKMPLYSLVPGPLTNLFHVAAGIFSFTMAAEFVLHITYPPFNESRLPS